MIRAIGGASLTVLLSAGVFGQSAPPVRAFEVASVKPHEGPAPIIGVSTSGQRLEGEAETVRGLVMWAYNLKNYQISSPEKAYSAVGDTFYDIVAKAEGDGVPTKAEFRQMLQLLLADRFKLKVHAETHEMPVYELVVGKNGPKFKESAPDASPMGRLGVSGRNYQVTMAKATMDDVVNAVANSFLDRPVVDKTGLTGTYEIKLTYTPATRANLASEPDLSDISIFTAVQEQLGLKLEPQKGRVEVLVVDHLEKPSAN
jgi:uncharacterized protein (TIGR03435 family)